MTEQQQGEVLAVHTSQLTQPNLAALAAQGYSILPEQSGWLVFVRTPQSQHQQQPDRQLACVCSPHGGAAPASEARRAGVEHKTGQE